ncbi:MAG TPA: fibronectin type III domain-containing protein, partial [Candidatus Polarisedimenticolia bacterium]|nr:fibronectin type III domain-containing protein [Candidatus Polarisedimenticolia bacterium]
MKSNSAVVRMLQFIHGLAFAIAFGAGAISVEAQTNCWTSPASGNWEDLTWSLGVRPAAGQDIAITNAGWKAVQLTHATAANFPASMTVNSITLAAPPDTINTLFLNNVGVPSPLTAGSITTGTNTVITMLSSALISSGPFNLNGTMNQGFFSGVTAGNLDISGEYSLTNGTLNVASNETLGGSPAGSVFNEEGGFHYAGQLVIEGNGTYNLRGGQLGGSITIGGGTLQQTGGDLSPNHFSLTGGSVLQTGGTGAIGPASIGTMSYIPNPPSPYTLSNGVPTFNSDLTINSLGLFDQEGGTNTIKGTLSVLSDHTYPDHPVRGAFVLNGGILSAQDIYISGTFNQGDGTNQVFGDATINGADYSLYSLSGGLLVTSNTTMLGGDGNFIQTGGRHEVSGTLSVTGGAEPAYGLYGGEVIAPTIQIIYGTFSHNGGTVANTGVLQLSGWWDEYTANQNFGQLQISTNDGSLWLGTNSAIVHFADSSGQAWGSGILHIRNWQGSLTGQGSNQVFFGNNAAGLTPAQVAQIRFDYFPSTEYTAKILPTGEVVPNPSGAPYAPTALGAQGISANQINLAWTDNSLDETGFKIERSPDGTNFVQIAAVAANTTSYSDATGLMPMTAYYYRIHADNSNG